MSFLPATLFSVPQNFLAISLVRNFFESTFTGQMIVAILLLGSVVGWTAMRFRFRTFRHVRVETGRFLQAFEHEGHPLGLFYQGHRFSDCPVFRVYLRGCEAAIRLQKASGGDPTKYPTYSPTQIQVIREAAEREMADQVIALETDFHIISIVTTAAPFLGLLGTVWGVMDSFSGMAVTGNPTLIAVAPGISAALLTTVVGLFVALPSLVGYNLLADSLRKQTVALDNFVQRLVGEFHIHCAEDA